MAMDAIFVDAYSQIFRGFYAIRFLSNSKNEPTNAIFAFAKLLMQLEKEFPSPYGGMAFDRGKVQFRLEILPEYKGTAFIADSTDSHFGGAVRLAAD